MESRYIDMAANGRLVIPAEVRRQLGIGSAERFRVEIENGTIRLVPFKEVLRRVRAEVRRHVPEGTDLVAELLEDRRREAELE